MTTKQKIGGALAILWVLLFTTSAIGMSGNQWKGLPSEAREAYVWGVVDTWFNVATLDVNRKQPSKDPIVLLLVDITRCLEKKMPYGQMSAIVQKYMDDNPSQWHYTMASLTFSALNEACEKIGAGGH